MLEDGEGRPEGCICELCSGILRYIKLTLGHLVILYSKILIIMIKGMKN